MQLSATKLNSTRVESMAYDTTENLMAVQFSNDGSHYFYYGVPRETYEAIINAPSIGKALQEKVIDQGFEYEKAENVIE